MQIIFKERVTSLLVTILDTNVRRECAKTSQDEPIAIFQFDCAVLE